MELKAMTPDPETIWTVIALVLGPGSFIALVLICS